MKIKCMKRKEQFIAFLWHYRLSLVVQIILSSTLLTYSIYMNYKLTLLYIKKIIWCWHHLCGLCRRRCRHTLNGCIFVGYKDRKGKFVFFSCHTIYSSITFIDVRTQKKAFPLTSIWYSFLSSIPSIPFVVVTILLTQCTFPIFYCHRFMLCSVSLFTNTIWQFFSLSKTERVLCYTLDITAITAMATKSLSPW